MNETTDRARAAGRAWLLAAFALEGVGEVLLMVVTAIVGAIVYAAVTAAHADGAPILPTGLVVAAGIVTAVGAPAALAAPAVRAKGLRVRGGAARRTATADASRRPTTR
jgi:hypothetical protein